MTATVFWAGCAPTQPVGATVVQERLVVPATAPDSIPADILDHLDPDYGVPPDILAVTFEPGLSRDRKSDILSAVGAIAIIGGAPVPLLDGIYIVRVRTGRDMLVLTKARDDLYALDDVLSAEFYTLLGRF